MVGPELAEVLSALISRVRGGAEQLPLVSRYDQAERLHSPFLPFLFQRPWGLRQQILTNMRVKTLLDRTVALAGLTDTAGAPLQFTPHDFRRIFATEAVATGLPVHIAAKLLGHQSLATTQAYVAVYDQDVIDHHRAFIARRRDLRPSVEYREPTDAEWDEFLGHFERRKVELGDCGRAYCSALPARACLHPMPDAAPRSQANRQAPRNCRDLDTRLAEAHDRGWLGEIEGLEASLAAARQKLTSMDRAVTSAGVASELIVPVMIGPSRSRLANSERS